MARQLNNYGMGRVVRFVVGCALFLATGFVHADDTNWLQWGGPRRDFMVNTSGLADKWPEKGPRELWSREMGDGYATIVLDGGILYTQYRPGEEAVSFVVAMDAATGKTVWEHKYESPFTDHMKQFGPGPASTPLIVGDRLFTIGTNMIMHCFDKKTGKVQWQVDFVKSFEAKTPGRGYCASPIAYKDTVIVPVGGKEGQMLVALTQSSGVVTWKALDFQPTHSSPLLIEFEGEEQLVFASKQDLLGIKPHNGELIWQAPLEADGVYLSSPLLLSNGRLFISSAYGGGSHLFQLSKKDGKTSAEQLWYERKLRIHHANAINIGDCIFGSSGDFGPAFLACMDAKTGKMVWRERGFSKANLVRADGKVIVLDEDGQLALTRMSRDGLEILGQCKVGELYAWAAPTIIGKTLYVRDRTHIKAFDLG
ncbi:MAG: PQQ-binding-like beta-propeller repeat protein [Planctomycetota bacterium]|jgi:outer membrane protein assembly factor BamB